MEDMKTLLDYQEQLKKLESEFETKKQELARKFVFDNAQFKVGDILKSSSSIIKVEKLKCSIYFNKPEIVYLGPELKKDLTPRKDGSRGSIYGEHDVTRIGTGTLNVDNPGTVTM